MDYKLGSIVIMKKEHPCKTNRFEIVVMMPRVEFNKKIKKVECYEKEGS